LKVAGYKKDLASRAGNRKRVTETSKRKIDLCSETSKKKKGGRTL
jgi:hypothetical protein